MARMGFSSAPGVKKHSQLSDVSTPHVLADLEGAVCSETEADTIAAALIAAKITSGTFVGDNADNRAIAHGLGVTPKLVLIAQVVGNDVGYALGAKNQNLYDDTVQAVTPCDTTNFYVSQTIITFNQSGRTIHWVAFG